MENSNSSMVDQNIKPKGKLRWYQYSLRTLLICVTLFAVACSWFALKRQKAKQQLEAVETLGKYGYSITYDYEYFSSENGYDHSPSAPHWILKLVGEDFLYNVYGVGEQKSIPLAALLEKVHSPIITDAEMVIFAHLPQLRKLIFRNIFGNPAKFTDKGVVYLENMKYLEVLDLSETQITDAGLKHLKGLTKLQRLNLNDTDVTDAGVKDLQNALPNVKIDHGKDANRFLNPFTN